MKSIPFFAQDGMLVGVLTLNLGHFMGVSFYGWTKPECPEKNQ